MRIRPAVSAARMLLTRAELGGIDVFLH